MSAVPRPETSQYPQPSTSPSNPGNTKVATSSTASSSGTTTNRPFKSRGSVWNARTVTAPIAAITMAFLLYTYSVTSIRAAKRNAQLHREADGGQLDMRRESLRRHGVLDKVEGTSGYQLFRDSRAEDKKETEMMQKKSGLAGESVGGALGNDGKELTGVRGRTDVEGQLEGYKGRPGERLREERG